MMKAREHSMARAALLTLLVAWPAGQALQADEPEKVKPPQEADIYPEARDEGIDEARVRATAIQGEILKAYFKDEAIRENRVNVAVDNGVVHLSGEVPSEEARERAEKIARETLNVVSVVNELKVAGAQ